MEIALHIRQGYFTGQYLADETSNPICLSLLAVLNSV